jgi:beta-lactamase regulating signal transducer with metallopeptidase domain
LSSLFTLEIIVPVICLAYGVGAAFLIGRWLLGYLALQRLLKDSVTAPPAVRHLFADIVGRGTRPRLLVSSRLRVPLSCGTLRPTIVLPASLLKGLGELGDLPSPALEARLLWVFAHELTHLRRRDAWSCLLFGLGQGLYFFWPWFWWLRRQVRLCQEYIADAAVVRLVGSAEDYAEFLLSMTTAPAVPTSATGVMGNSSDLFRRVTMLLKTPRRMKRTVSWRWTLATAGGLLALAIVTSGVGPRAVAGADLDVKKAEPTDQTTPNDEKEAPKAPTLPQPPQPPGVAPFGGLQFDDGDNQNQMVQQMRQMQSRMGGMGFFGGQGPWPRLGIRVSPPSDALADQLDLPKGQGLVVDQVMPDQPASKAGMKTNDILLEFNGKPVPNNVAEFVRSLQEVKPDAKVDAVVLRKGKKETIKGMTLPEEKQPGFGRFAGPQGGFPGFGQGGAGFGGTPAGNAFGRGFGVGQGVASGMMGFAGPNTVMTTMFRQDNNFTTRHQEGSLIITVTGTVADGKGKTNKIHVQDGQVTHEYESVDKVPDQYKDKVKNLVEMSEKGSIKIEIKTPDAKAEAKPEAK